MWKILLISMLLVLPSYGSDRYPFTNLVNQERFEHLTHQFRCLVCQNEDLASSNAGLANDLRGKIYHMLMSGKTDAEITTYLVNRYGNFILFKPPISQETYFLWFGPLIFLLIGMGIFIVIIL